MKKIIALMLSLLLCFTMLVSCGDDDEEEESSSEPASESGAELPSENTDADNIIKFD